MPRVPSLVEFAILGVLLSHPSTPAQAKPHDGPQERPAAPFVPNLGQWPASARYVARDGVTQLGVDERGWMLVANPPRPPSASRQVAAAGHGRGVALRMQFLHTTGARLAAGPRLPGWHNYFLGDGARRWRTRVPLFASVTMTDVHPGVDVTVRSHAGGFEYDLLLAPGADLSRVVVRVDGAERLRIDRHGALVADTAAGPLVQPVPVTWVGADARKQPIDCAYVLLGPDTFGFRAPDWSGEDCLVVDPRLVFGTYLGTGGDDIPAAIDASAGAVTVAGNTTAATFPVTAGAFSTTFGGTRDAFVTRMDANGTRLLWSTFLGGAQWESVASIAVDASGETIVGGMTESFDFPTTPGAFDRTANGGSDGFLLRLDPTGGSLQWSTYFGGGTTDQPWAMVVDGNGVATLVGETFSQNYPTTPGALRLTPALGFITRFAADGGSLIWSTYFPGRMAATPHCAALDGAGNVTVVLSSDSFPVTAGAYSTRLNGPLDGVVAQVDASGSSLRWATYLGGSWIDFPSAVTVDPGDTVTVTGTTHSGDFPTTPRALRRSWAGMRTSGFVTRLSADGSALVWSTFLTSSLSETPTEIASSPEGDVTVAGWTMSGDFPTTPDALQRSVWGGSDAFVTQLHRSGSRLLFSTLLGGERDEQPAAIDVLGRDVVVANRTTSTNHPTTPGCFDATYGGGFDVAVARLATLPAGVARFGDATPHCHGVPSMHALEDATAWRSDFGLAATGAPPGAPGIVAFAGRGLPAGVPILGVDVWFDVLTVLAAPGVVTDANGECSIRFPLPDSGQRFVAQWIWLSPACVEPLTASDGVSVVVQ